MPLSEPEKKECAMKLDSAQVQRTLGQFEASVIPNDSPMIAKLNELFGEHTFFLDDQHGLNIVEPVEAAEPAAERAKVVNVASWTDDSRSSLKPHAPAVTDIVVTLGSRH
jgi:hypothetical protein